MTESNHSCHPRPVTDFGGKVRHLCPQKLTPLQCFALALRDLTRQFRAPWHTRSGLGFVSPAAASFRSTTGRPLPFSPRRHWQGFLAVPSLNSLWVTASSRDIRTRREAPPARGAFPAIFTFATRPGGAKQVALRRFWGGRHFCADISRARSAPSPLAAPFPRASSFRYRCPRSRFATSRASLLRVVSGSERRRCDTGKTARRYVEDCIAAHGDSRFPYRLGLWNSIVRVVRAVEVRDKHSARSGVQFSGERLNKRELAADVIKRKSSKIRDRLPSSKIEDRMPSIEREKESWW